MTNLKLHLDADTSRISLWRALLERGYDVTRTPNDWMPRDASDEFQLLGATSHNRCNFTFNIRDFVALAKIHPNHGGIILSSQKPMSILLRGLDRLLSDLDSESIAGEVRWLNDWL